MPGYIGVDIYQLPVYWTLFYEKIAKTVINLSKKRVSCRILRPFQIYFRLSESTCIWDLHGCTVGFRYETLLPGCWYLWAPCLLNPFLWEEKKEALIILSKGETCSLLLIYLPLSIFTWIQYMSKMHVQLFYETLLPPPISCHLEMFAFITLYTNRFARATYLYNPYYTSCTASS